MVGKKAYELPVFRVVRRQNEDVLTGSVEESKDSFFVTDSTDWSGLDNS